MTTIASAIQGRSYAIDVLRALAILLITYSHLDRLLPDPRWSTGGALGNALFFFISGYGLALSWANSERIGLLQWLSRRLRRVYVPVWLATAMAFLFFVEIFRAQEMGAIERLVWPTSYWFVSAIVVFYLPFYLVLSTGSYMRFYGVALTLIGPYFFIYWTSLDLQVFSIESGYFKWIFYFQVMCLGAAQALTHRSNRPMAPRWFAVLFLGYFLFKVAMVPLGLTQLQFLLHVLTVGMVLASMGLADWILRNVGQSRLLNWYIGLTASISFEMYLVQHFLHSNARFTEIFFPLNVILFWPLCYLLAMLLNRLIRVSNSLLDRLLLSMNRRAQLP